MASETLDTEVELISASLLPEETASASTSLAWPRIITIINSNSGRSLHVAAQVGYPKRNSVSVELRGNDITRRESENWMKSIDELMNEWDESEDYPLYQLLTTHLLPLIAPSLEAPKEAVGGQDKKQRPALCHALLTSHHLLSSTKRKNFLALSSQLSLAGFSKVGHPGIYYAMGEEDDLAEWVREVKSWNWLALRIRVGVEPVGDGGEQVVGRGSESGARGGKGRGDWVELEKISDALEYMRRLGRESMLLDIGIGSGAE